MHMHTLVINYGINMGIFFAAKGCHRIHHQGETCVASITKVRPACRLPPDPALASTRAPSSSRSTTRPSPEHMQSLRCRASAACIPDTVLQSGAVWPCGLWPLHTVCRPL